MSGVHRSEVGTTIRLKNMPVESIMCAELSVFEHHSSPSIGTIW